MSGDTGPRSAEPCWPPGKWVLTALVLLGVLAPVAVHWLQGKTLVWFDTQRLYAPERWLVDEALRAFRLPLWNPYLGGGVPMFADAIHGVLHPVSVLAAWLGSGRSVDLLIAGHLAFAGLGAALLALEMGASRHGAAVAAFTFALSGYVLSMAGNLVFLAGAGSLPLCVAGLRRSARAPGPIGLALGAGGVVLLAFTGDLQALMVGGALGLALTWEGAGWRGALRAGGIGLLGLLVAGVQLLPSAAHFLRSGRMGWSPDPAAWALQPWRVAELVLPGLLWGDDPLMDPVFSALAGPAAWPQGNLAVPFAASVFVGVMPLALAAASARDGRRGRVLGALAVVLLWVALGPALGAAGLLSWVPIWGSFQFSEKLVGPMVLVLGVMAALGLDALADRRVGARWVLGIVAFAAVAACGVGVRELSGLDPKVRVLAEDRVVRGAWHLAWALVALGGWLGVRRWLGPSSTKAVAVAAVWVGMVTASGAALRPGDPAARLDPPGPVLRAPPPGPRVVSPYTYEPDEVTPGHDWLDQAALDHASFAYVAHNVRGRLDSIDLYGAMASARWQALLRAFGARWALAARRYGVTHVLAATPRTEAHRNILATVTTGAVRENAGPARGEVWAVPHRPWAGFAASVETVVDSDEALAATARAITAGSEGVVIESSSHFPAASGRVLSVARGLETARVEAESVADATLVVNDAWWPGWEATIDGRPASLFPADALVRAIRWPAGRHVLEMRYRPPEVRAGAWVSVAGLVLVAGWILVDRRRGGSAGSRAGSSAEGSAGGSRG